MAFTKGTSGNPNGRPKGLTFRSVIREVLSRPIPGKGNKTRYLEWAESIIKEAESLGNPAKMEIIKFLEGATPYDKGTPDDDLEEPESADVHGNTLDP